MKPPFHVEQLEPAATELLAGFAALVGEWAPRLDLVSTLDESPDRVVTRHIADSLRALDLVRGLPPGATAVDVGAGGGFPGVPLAIAGPRVRWTFLEPRRRRAAFLEEVTRRLDLRIEVLTLTAEAAARAGRGGYRLATARALASPPRAFELLLPLLGGGGRAAVWVGRSAVLPSEATEGPPGIATMVRSGPVPD